MNGIELIKDQLNEIMVELESKRIDRNIIADYTKTCQIEIEKIDSQDSVMSTAIYKCKFCNKENDVYEDFEFDIENEQMDEDGYMICENCYDKM